MHAENIALLIPFFAIFCIFIAFPWMILQFVVKIRQAGAMSPEDERMIADIWRSAREMERRIVALEAIVEPDQSRPAAAPRRPSDTVM